MLCATEQSEVAYHSAGTADTAQYYVDSGATGHFINELNALHDYTPFEVPRTIRTAESGHIQAVGSGTLKFTATVNGKKMIGELKNVYYLPGIHTRLISIGKLFSQGWDPRLSKNGFNIYNDKGELVIRAPMKDNAHTVTLRTVYPDFGLCAHEAEGEEVTDEQLHERLKLKCESPLVAFSAGEKTKSVSLLDWHRRMGHRSMKTIVKMAKGAATGITLDLPDNIPKLDSCPSCALTKTRHTPFKSGRSRATKPLELIHGDLVGPMPVESVSKCKYGFVLMDDYTRASWVLLLKAKSTHRQNSKSGST